MAQKKIRSLSFEEKKQEVEKDSALSIREQVALLELNRSSVYYTPHPVSTRDLALMKRIDEIHTKSPCYGRRTMTAQLNREHYAVGEEHVAYLMRTMGIYAIYPKKHTSVANPEHRVFPYLLKGIKAENPDHIWGYDITYIRMVYGFMYLCAILDWYSRYVVSWVLSERMDVWLTLETWRRALDTGRKPTISNSDQGSQMTANQMIDLLQREDIRISMDHKGRCFDNIFTERLWRSVKYEEVYIKEYDSPREAQASLRAYFDYYNNERLHASLQYATPKEIYLTDKK